jgi:hypothetical protein
MRATRTVLLTLPDLVTLLTSDEQCTGAAGLTLVSLVRILFETCLYPLFVFRVGRADSPLQGVLPAVYKQRLGTPENGRRVEHRKIVEPPPRPQNTHMEQRLPVCAHVWEQKRFDPGARSIAVLSDRDEPWHGGGGGTSAGRYQTALSGARLTAGPFRPSPFPTVCSENIELVA